MSGRADDETLAIHDALQSIEYYERELHDEDWKHAERLTDARQKLVSALIRRQLEADE